MKNLILVLFCLGFNCFASAQNIEGKPKKTKSDKPSSQSVKEKNDEKLTAVPITTSKSTTPVDAELKAVEEKPLKTENPKN
jgi:hypothetical protein